MKLRRFDDGRYNALAWEFYRKQQKMEALKKKFEEDKADFESEMDGLLEGLDAKTVRFGGTTLSNGATEVLQVTRSQRTTVTWFAEKLEKKVTRPIRRKIIRKKYSIHDMVGLSRYLQSCGVDPEEFKKYLTVEKSVDVAELERLSELGEITTRHVAGCYMVSCQKPYFTLTVKKDDGDAQ